MQTESDRGLGPDTESAMKFVVGYHESRNAQAAFKRAVELAKERGAELHLVTVIEQPRTEDEGRRYQEEHTREEQKLQAVADRLAPEVTAQAHVPVGVSRPADAILFVAGQEDADMIVIGMRRRSRVGKLVLGSTAQQILLDSECDVLAVKAPAQD